MHAEGGAGITTEVYAGAESEQDSQQVPGQR